MLNLKIKSVSIHLLCLFNILLAALVHPDNQMLGFLAYSPVDALGAMELPHGEFLLVFNTLGVYVDMQGRKSRDREIMYPAVPTVSERVSI